MQLSLDCMVWGTYAGYGVCGAVQVGDEAVAYLPGEDGRTVGLEADDLAHDVAGRHARLAAADRARSVRPGLVETTEDLAHTPVRHLHHRVSTSPARCTLFIGWSDVAESMATTRSPFCGYNMA